jgi:FtsZ-interacting cell division protein ZipA
LAELRWILMGISLPLLGGIWWWSVRQSRQAPGNAELRESPGKPPGPSPAGAPPAAATPAQPDSIGSVVPDDQPRDWGVPPFEPLSIRTADFERVPHLDRPMMAHVDTLDLRVDVEPAAATVAAQAVPVPLPATPIPAAPVSLPAAPLPARPPIPAAPAAEPYISSATAPPARPNSEHGDRIAGVAAPVPNGSELQRIVTLRVCAVGDVRWPGTELMAAFESLGLSFGRYQVFHRKHVDGRSLFCVASLIEPGTFDVTRMGQEEFRGVTLFAVLPGPLEPLQTLDALFATARGLAERLSGMMQDAKGMPFSPQRAAALREDVAHFQALLSA